MQLPFLVCAIVTAPLLERGFVALSPILHVDTLPQRLIEHCIGTVAGVNEAKSLVSAVVTGPLDERCAVVLTCVRDIEL